MIEHYNKHRLNILIVLVLAVLLLEILHVVSSREVAGIDIASSGDALQGASVKTAGQKASPPKNNDDAEWRATYYKDRIARLAQAFKHTADANHNATCVSALTEYYTRRTEVSAKEGLRIIQTKCPAR